MIIKTRSDASVTVVIRGQIDWLDSLRVPPNSIVIIENDKPKRTKAKLNSNLDNKKYLRSLIPGTAEYIRAVRKLDDELDEYWNCDPRS